MKSIDFPSATLKIGASQTETYNVLHALPMPGSEGELIMCFELTNEEIERIKETKKIYYSRLLFDNRCQSCGAKLHFQPMKLQVDLSDGIELT